MSRYDLIGDKDLRLVKNAYYSQDTLCLRSNDLKNIEESHLSALNINLGIPRCDNKMAYEFWLRNWQLVNPCLRINTIHHHKSGIRNYETKDRTIIGNVAFVYPSEGIDEESKFSLMLFTLTNRVPISFQMTSWLINDFDNKKTKPNKKIFSNIKSMILFLSFYIVISASYSAS